MLCVHTHTYCIYSAYKRQLYFVHVCVGSSPHVIYLWNIYFYIISFTSHQLFREDSLLWHQKQRLVLAVGVNVCQSTCRSQRKSLWGKKHRLYSKYNTHWLIENTSFQNWTPTSTKEGELEAEAEEDMVKVKVMREPLFQMSFRMVTYVPNHGLTMRETAPSPT